MLFQTSQRWLVQIYEDLEKQKTSGTVFYVHNKLIVIKLPNHGESCYATDEGKLSIFLVDVTIRAVSDCIPIFAVWQYNYLKSSVFYMSNRRVHFASTSRCIQNIRKGVNKLSIASTSWGQA